MAEPMSSNEIEDVLSSIRRLVATDLKPADRAKLAAVADATQKLVLAPENRVEEGGDHAVQGGKFATVRRPSRRAAFPPVETVLSAVAGDGMNGELAQHAAAESWSLGENAARAKPPELSPSQQAAMQAALDGYLQPDERGADLYSQAQGEENNAASRFAGSDEDKGLTAQQSDFSVNYDMPMSDEVHIDPSARMVDVDAQSMAAAQQDVRTTWAEEEPEDLPESDLAEPSVNPDFSGLHGTIEPDSDWADAAEARVIAELAGEAVADDVVEQAKASFREPNFKSIPQASSEVLFDEDQLRAMVQTIFREEMAGPMGERITRNIRKLVRAEVGRMLAAHELE